MDRRWGVERSCCSRLLLVLDPVTYCFVDTRRAIGRGQIMVAGSRREPPNLLCTSPYSNRIPLLSSGLLPASDAAAGRQRRRSWFASPDSISYCFLVEHVVSYTLLRRQKSPSPRLTIFSFNGSLTSIVCSMFLWGQRPRGSVSWDHDSNIFHYIGKYTVYKHYAAGDVDQ